MAHPAPPSRGPGTAGVPRATRFRATGFIPLWFILAAVATPAAADSIALTFDDLPVFGVARPVAEQAAITRKLLRGLVRHRLPATGFVNEINLEGPDRPARIALLSAWLDAGMDLGNHTYSHPSLTMTPVADYITDTARGDAVTRPLLAARGRTERWFRYPYLETGPTLVVRRTFEDWLAAAHYRVAPVTCENSDYLFADQYDAALAHGAKARAKAIRLEYLDFSTKVIAWYRSAAVALLGRPLPLVWLLHASKLNADSIGALAKVMHRQRLAAITLDAAMADPAYAQPEDYAGPDGNEWLERWSETLHRALPWGTMPPMPKDIAVERADVAAPGVP